MYISCRARCYECQAPLKISFKTEGDTRDWLYTWILKENIDLGFNTVKYKKVGTQIKRVCYDCVQSLSDADIFDWIRRGNEYVKTVSIERVPIIFLWTYWLLVPGLYSWYHQKILTSYADLHTWVILL